MNHQKIEEHSTETRNRFLQELNLKNLDFESETLPTVNIEPSEQI